MPNSTTHSMAHVLANPRLLVKRSLPFGASLLALALASCGGTNQSQAPAAQAPAPAVATAVVPSPAVEPALQAKLDAFTKQTVTLRVSGQQWQPQTSELGATAIIENNRLQVAVDEGKLRAYLGQIAPQVAQPAVDAALTPSGEELAITPSAVGRVLDIDGSVVRVGSALQQGNTPDVQLPTKTQAPTITTADAEAAKDQATAFLEQPFELTVGKKTYTWDAETLAPMLVFKPTNAGTLDLAADPTPLAAAIVTLADRSEQPAREPMVDWNGGNLQIRAPGQNGTRLDEARAADAIGQAISQGNHAVTLATQPLAPKVTSANLDTLGIDEVVSIGKSDFTGSADYRITNILAGMKLLNGMLIAPGAEFSFNNTVGEIDAANGFVEGHAIVNNRTQIEFGGGICQDSTTVFRAAFWAGLPITERKEHSYYISWYDKYGLGPNGNGPGLDAAIFTGVQDMRFVNDTDHWLLLQASANPKTAVAQVTLYGTKPNREITITHKIVKRTPAIARPEYIADAKQPRGSMKRTDTARGGMQIQVYRTVKTNGQEAKPELFATSFKPWPNKYSVNPADMGADGIPVFLAPTATVTPTVDPALPTADPMLPAPEANVQPQPTADLGAPAPTADPNMPVFPGVSNPLPTPTDPVQATPDPNVQPQAAEPTAQPAADQNSAPPSG